MQEQEFDLVALNAGQVVSESDPFTPRRYELMARFIASARKVLDVGCNTGRGGAHLKTFRPDIDLTGLDAVPARIKALPSAYNSAILSQGISIAAPAETFDAVIAGEIIEHIPPSDVDKTLCEFQRVLRVGGRLVMTTPNPGSWLMRHVRRQTVYTESHLTQHWPRVLSWRLKMHGFSRVRLYGCGKTTRYLGIHLPLNCYGAFLITADKW